MKYDQRIIAKICDSVSIVNIISQYISLSKKGQNYCGLCPFHPDSNPSLFISPTKKIFKCFVCNSKGNVINFVAMYNNLTFEQAIKLIAKDNNLDQEILTYLNRTFVQDQQLIKYLKINQQACELYHLELLEKKNHAIMQYLFSRGLDEQDIKKYKIGYAPGKQFLFDIMTNNNVFGSDRDQSLIWNAADLVECGLVAISEDNKYYDFFNERIILPIINLNNEIIAFSGRTIANSTNKYLNTKNNAFYKKDCFFYNEQIAFKTKQTILYITEGFFDAIMANKKGINNIVALMGTNFSKQHFLKIKKNDFKIIRLCLDNDFAGLSTTLKIGEQLFTLNFKNVWVVKKYESNYKDLCDLGLALEKGEFVKILENIDDFISFKISVSFVDLQEDEKIVKLAEIQNYIIDYGDLNLWHRYAKAIANATDLDYENIITSLKLLFDQKKATKNNFLQLNKTTINKPSFFSDLNIQYNTRYEKEIHFLILMSFSPELVYYYLKYLNSLIVIKNDHDYKYFLQTIIWCYNQHYSDFNKEIILHLEQAQDYYHLNLSKIINAITKVQNEIKKLPVELIIIRGLNFLKEFLKRNQEDFDNKINDKVLVNNLKIATDEKIIEIDAIIKKQTFNLGNKNES